jgi:hypothetical protein
MGERGEALAAGIDDEVGDFAIKRIALAEKLGQPGERIRSLE